MTSVVIEEPLYVDPSTESPPPQPPSFRLPVYVIGEHITGDSVTQPSTSSYFEDDTFFNVIDTTNLTAACANHVNQLKPRAGADSKAFLAAQTAAFENCQILASLQDAKTKYPGHPILIVKNSSDGNATGTNLAKLTKATFAAASPFDVLYLSRPAGGVPSVKGAEAKVLDFKEIPGLLVDRVHSSQGLQAVVYMPKARDAILANGRESVSGYLGTATALGGPLTAKTISRNIFTYNPNEAVFLEDTKRSMVGQVVRERATRGVNGWAVAFWITLIVLIVVLVAWAIVYSMHKKIMDGYKNGSLAIPASLHTV